MPSEKELAREVALWAAADSPAARDDLVRLVMPHVRRHARRIAKQYGHPDPDALESDGLLRVVRALNNRTWKAELGGWVNYAVTAACRAMAQAAKKQINQPDHKRLTLAAGEAEPADDPEGRAGVVERVRAAVAGLSPIERLAVEEMGPLRPPDRHPPGRRRNTASERAAKTLGVTVVMCEAIYGRAMKKIGRALTDDPAAG